MPEETTDNLRCKAKIHQKQNNYNLRELPTCSVWTVHCESLWSGVLIVSSVCVHASE